MYFCILAVWFTILVSVYGQDQVFYCAKDSSLTEINKTKGQIRTVYEGDNYYGKNYRCLWLIDAGSDETRIQVTVTDLDVQWAPENAICNGYDYMDMYNGDNKNSPLLVSFCGSGNPRSITTTGRYMYLTFSSNDRNNDYRGITLQYEVFVPSPSPGSCPPGWHDDNTDSDKNACYQVKLHKEIFSKAQQYCNYDQANLVSLEDEKEADFVTELLKSSLEENEYAWIGLSDKRKEGQYEWIDQINSNLEYRWHIIPHVPSPYWNCVVIRGRDWKWEEQFCTESEVQTLVKRKFVCKAKRYGNTTLYPVPPDRPEDEDPFPNSHVKWIILGAVLAVIVIIIGAVAVLCMTKYRGNTNNTGLSAREDGVRMATYPIRRESPPPPYEEAVTGSK